MKYDIGLAGRYTLWAVNADTGAIRELGEGGTRLEFDNLITDLGLNMLGTGGIGSTCFVGSGSTAPAVSNTSLVSQVASSGSPTATSGGANGQSPYYAWYRQTWRFQPGAATGNLSEVGVGTASNSLFSRSLIKDGNGNPTTITILSNEFLDVLYELRLYAPTADVTGTVNISGTNYAYTLRAAGVTNWSGQAAQIGLRIDTNYGASLGSGDIGTVTQDIGGTIASSIPCTNNAYSNNSYKSTGSINCGLNDANFQTGVKSVSYGGSPNSFIRFQASFTPPIPKTSDKTLSLNVEVSWARV